MKKLIALGVILSVPCAFTANEDTDSFVISGTISSTCSIDVTGVANNTGIDLTSNYTDRDLGHIAYTTTNAAGAELTANSVQDGQLNSASESFDLNYALEFDDGTTVTNFPNAAAWAAGDIQIKNLTSNGTSADLNIDFTYTYPGASAPAASDYQDTINLTCNHN